MTKQASPEAHLQFARVGILAAAALFSTGGAAIKASSLGPWQIAGGRSLIAALTLAVLVPAALKAIRWQSLVVATAYATTLVLFVLANKLTTAANAIFLQGTAPLYVMLLGVWLLGEKVKRREVVIMGVIALGLACFFVQPEAARVTATDPLTGNLLATCAGVTWALTLIGLRWLGRQEVGGSSSHSSTSVRRDGALASVIAGNVLVALVCFPIAAQVEGVDGWSLFGSGIDLGILLYLGVFQIGLAYRLMTVGVRSLPALETSLLLMMEPVLSPFWAWFFHGEMPGVWAFSGCTIIFAATLALVLLGQRGRGSAAPTAA